MTMPARLLLRARVVVGETGDDRLGVAELLDEHAVAVVAIERSRGRGIGPALEALTEGDGDARPVVVVRRVEAGVEGAPAPRPFVAVEVVRGGHVVVEEEAADL